MSNLYPPILESQRESIASLPLMGSFFSIPFTMPLSVVTAEIGHVQVLIRRQANLDSWSKQTRPVAVPEKEVIYLPGFKASAAAHGTNCLRRSGTSDLWYVDVPIALIRGITSVGGGDTGLPGFPAGGTEKEGETFTIQIRFGDSALTFTTTNTFAQWKQVQVTSSLFGEWSNTQRMFVFALPTGGLTVADMFNVSVVNDPIAKLAWDYTPVSLDPLSQVRISYSWSTPDDYGNSFRSKNLDFESHDGRGASSAGEIDLGVMRFTPLTITLQFITVNNTSYTWIADSSNMLCGAFTFSQDSGAMGTMSKYPIVGEELEDGVIALNLGWTWTAQTIIGSYRVYRVDAMTLETVLLQTVEPLASALAGSAFTTTVKDYSVEMGAEYIYIVNAYRDDGSYLSTLVWTPGGPLEYATWNPPLYPGYQRQMNFNGNIFLNTKWQQLRLQGNVNVSNFQRNVSDQFTTTIGGEYPFYSRSARFNYRTMSIQALISLNFDSTNTFLRFKSQMTTTEMQVHLDDAVKRYQNDIATYPRDSEYNRRVIQRQATYYVEISMIYRGINPITGQSFLSAGVRPEWMNGQLWMRENQDVERLILRSTELFTEDQFSANTKRVKESHNPTSERLARVDLDRELTRGATTIYNARLLRNATEVRYSDRMDDLVYAERRFREAVMRWATDGQPKLLRSETEGNMIVMMSGVSFTPFNKTRRLYNMSATVTEIAEYNLANLILYGLVPVDFTAFYVPSTNDILGDDDMDIELGTFKGNTYGYLYSRGLTHQQLAAWTHDQILSERLV